MNDDLISRQAAIDAILAEVEDEDRPIVETRWWNIGMTRASVIVHDMPSAQQEIIRCKDCKYRAYLEGYFSTKSWYCGFEADNGDPYVITRNAGNEMYYCADAERKEDE